MDTIRLDVENVRWLEGIDSTHDLCAHGDVVFDLDGRSAWATGSDDLCVSAAAMNLLRTLEQDHPKEDPVTDDLFPHCGHMWWLSEDHGLVNIAGCSAGKDALVFHRGKNVVIQTPAGGTAEILRTEWVGHVCAFADKVEALYQRSDPKEPDADDAAWYELFWPEWRARRARAQEE
ncbi:hypothetical protein [Rubricoccus marinus]|uniref:Uncharacterized protein n=1 Tax=Rubricoccus marinus TaxID=716817 RepID=A0A259U282_9BACT|nr:hypothetical protein [Rubricoccus marinus]OZC04056.1 hypothetical protein BSZ36_14315 [Rubricoccus marinus]